MAIPHRWRPTMKITEPLERADCPIKCLGTGPDGKTFWFLNDRAELVGLTADQLGNDGFDALFTKTASQEWLHRHFPKSHIPHFH